MNLPAQNRSSLSILLVLALGLCAIYCIPFYVPVRDGLSFSFIFGYSNRTAILLLASFALAFSIWTRGFELALPDPTTESQTSSRYSWRITVAAIVIGCCFVWLFAWLVVPLGEAQYFLDRYEMFRMGGHLFRDFEFDYGPLMFYLPVWISRISRLTLGNSYYLAWTLQWALGGWILWKTVAIAATGTRHARTIYLLLWLFFCSSIIDSGTNYTPIRFALPLLFALLVWKLYTRGASHLAIFSLASAAATALLFYSPEQGVVFTVGTLLYFLVCVRSRRPGTLAALGTFCIVMTGVFWLALKVGALDNIRTVSSGVLNFPILFSFQTLILLLFVIATGCAAVAAFRTRTSDHPLLYLICLSAISMPAAFSRADTGHIIINSLGALIAILVVLSQYPAIWRWTWSSLAIVILLGSIAHAEYYFDEIVRQVFVASRGTRTANPNSSVPTSVPLPEHANLFAPLGVQRRLTSFADNPKIVTGRYPWLFPMTSLGMIQEKIDELKVHPEWPLLLPSQRPVSCAQNPNGMREKLKQVLLAPYIPRPRAPIPAAVPLCDYLNANYRQSNYQSPVPAYSVWVPKGDSHAVP